MNPISRVVGVCSVLAVMVLAGLVPITSAASTTASTTDREPRVTEPDINKKWISYGAARRRQMAAYSDRHYGERESSLEPEVIVEHFTASNSFSSTWNYFNSNGPYNGERPNVCAHFLIDSDGEIFQLVPTDLRCRHVIGLNHRAIGIEMVGTSDKQIMRRERQYDAAQQLTVWLMDSYGVQLGDVIGHSESLNSPYHHEKVKAWRCQTHADWSHRHMNRFRDDLRDLAEDEDVEIGDAVNREPSNCG